MKLGKNAARWLWNNRYALIVIEVAMIVRIPFVDMMQRWDAGEYYWRFSEAVSKCSFTSLSEYMELFSLCNHPTLLFSLIYIPGELLFPGQIIGVSITSMILTAFALWCIYRIIERCVPGNDMLRSAASESESGSISAATCKSQSSRLSVAICVAVVSWLPLFYSTTTYFNPDYAMACFVVITIYAFIYDKPILAGLGSAFCFQTKEPGIVIIFGLVVGTFVRHVREELKSRRKMEASGEFIKSCIMQIARDKCLYTTLAATICQILYMVHIGGVSNWTQTDGYEPGLTWDNYGSNCLGINPEYILTKFKQHFILNFNWIFVLIIIAGVAILIIRQIRTAKSEHDTDNVITNEYLSCVVGAFAAYIAFSFIYITEPMARYNVVGDVLLAVIALCVMERTVPVLTRSQNGAAYALKTAVIVLLVIECFVTIDPLTKRVFRNLDGGGTVLCYMGDKYTADEDFYYGDNLIYNTQYMYIDKAYDNILMEVGYDTSWSIIVPSYNGNYMSNSIYATNWDNVRKRRVFYTDENTEVLSYVWIVDLIAANYQEMSDKAVLIINPYYLGQDSQSLLDETLKYYDVVDDGEYSSIWGTMSYYVLQKHE